MGLHAFSVHHGLHGLAAVDRASAGAAHLGPQLSLVPGVRGVVTVATCNRVEAYVDAVPAVDPEALEATVVAALQTDATELTAAERPLAIHRQHEVLGHLFRVAAGLDSMVVGEREIAGQLRRSLSAASAAGTTTHALTESFERALRTSRRVAQLPELAAVGRSIVAAALDLTRVGASTRALVLGTGAYAGATLAALRERGCTDIAVYSPTGRAPQFAASHDCVAVPVDELAYAARGADVVISCRGAGVPLLTVDFVRSLPRSEPLTIVDLALSRDVEAGVDRLDGVDVIDLERIQTLVPAPARAQLAEAHELVRDGVTAVEQLLTGRQMDPAVVALADSVQQMVDDEIARLPHEGTLTADDAAHALRRLAARMIHGPRVRAREAALQGRAEEFLAGLEVIYGIEAELDTSYVELDPATLDGAQCPVTGLGLDDLRAPVEEEAR